jgi:hypothetical protein
MAKPNTPDGHPMPVNPPVKIISHLHDRWKFAKYLKSVTQGFEEKGVMQS